MFIFYVLSVQAISKVKNTQIKCFFNDKLKDTDSFNCGTREKPVRCFSVTVSRKHTASMRTDTSSYASLISHIVVFQNETAVIILLYKLCYLLQWLLFKYLTIKYMAKIVIFLSPTEVNRTHCPSSTRYNKTFNLIRNTICRFVLVHRQYQKYIVYLLFNKYFLYIKRLF